MVVLTLAQSKLRDQVNGLVERMNSRLVVSDPSFKKIAELLPKAAEQMTAAEKKLQAQSPDGALPPENMALQFLQQAEEEFELQVQTGRQAGGGGGGGGAGSIAEDLADLFKLEMDKMANQYETNSQASTQQQDQQIDELAEKLKELARRQEQEIERQRRLAAGQSAGMRRRRPAARAGRAGRRSGAPAREAVARSESPGPRRHRAAVAQRRRCDAARRGQGRSVSGRPGGRGRRTAARSAAAADEQPERRAASATCRTRSARPRRSPQEQQDIASDAKGLPQAGPDRLQQAQMLGQRKDALENKVAEPREAARSHGRRDRRANRATPRAS